MRLHVISFRPHLLRSRYFPTCSTTTLGFTPPILLSNLEEKQSLEFPPSGQSKSCTAVASRPFSPSLLSSQSSPRTLVMLLLLLQEHSYFLASISDSQVIFTRMGVCGHGSGRDCCFYDRFLSLWQSQSQTPSSSPQGVGAQVWQLNALRLLIKRSAAIVVVGLFHFAKSI